MMKKALSDQAGQLKNNDANLKPELKEGSADRVTENSRITNAQSKGDHYFAPIAFVI